MNHRPCGILFAAPASNSGKTTVVCAVLSALKRRGLQLHAFKCGPDYIDPMFHRSVLGIPCHNLDLYLTPETLLKKQYALYSSGADISVVEGVMGYYDGLGGVTKTASAWNVAEVLGLSTVLVLRPKGTALTLSSVVNGLLKVPSGGRIPSEETTSAHEPEDSHIKGILLNDCSPMLYTTLKPMLERETGLPVLGYLPHLPGAVIESRHLGLQTAGEINTLQESLELLGKTAEETIDLDALMELGANAGPDSLGDLRNTSTPPAVSSAEPTVRIAVAKDNTFCFCYEETLDAFRAAGAEPVFFSPLMDKALPEGTSALYLPGGYPELYAKQLSDNEPLRKQIKEAVQNGLPTVAECGGFLYLQKTLETPDGEVFPMVGVLPGAGVKTDRLVRFGYAELAAEEDTLLAPANTPLRTHNFHYWDSTERGSAFQAVKPVTGRSYDTGFATETLYAAFPHLSFAGNPAMTERFVNAAKTYIRTKEECSNE